MIGDTEGLKRRSQLESAAMNKYNKFGLVKANIKINKKLKWPYITQGDGDDAQEIPAFWKYIFNRKSLSSKYF